MILSGQRSGVWTRRAGAWMSLESGVETGLRSAKTTNPAIRFGRAPDDFPLERLGKVYGSLGESAKTLRTFRGFKCRRKRGNQRFGDFAFASQLSAPLRGDRLLASRGSVAFPLRPLDILSAGMIPCVTFSPRWS